MDSKAIGDGDNDVEYGDTCEAVDRVFCSSTCLAEALSTADKTSLLANHLSSPSVGDTVHSGDTGTICERGDISSTADKNSLHGHHVSSPLVGDGEGVGRGRTVCVKRGGVTGLTMGVTKEWEAFGRPRHGLVTHPWCLALGQSHKVSAVCECSFLTFFVELNDNAAIFWQNCTTPFDNRHLHIVDELIDHFWQWAFHLRGHLL